METLEIPGKEASFSSFYFYLRQSNAGQGEESVVLLDVGCWGGTIQYFGLDHPCKFFGVHEIKTCFFKRCYQEENCIQKGVHQKQYFF